MVEDGWPWIGSLCVLALVTGIGISLWGWLFLVPAAAIAYFFRNPSRTTDAGPGMAVAPGDGVIVEIEDAQEAEFMEGPCRKIGIFLRLFDVHVNYAPVAGDVIFQRYRPGTFHVASRGSASLENEANTIGIVAAEGRFLVRQVAGYIARRIVSRCAVGSQVRQGSLIGWIRFGSRVDLFLPRSWNVVVSVGQRVTGGVTIVAREREEIS